MNSNSKLFPPILLALVASLPPLLSDTVLAKIVISAFLVVGIFLLIYPRLYFILFLVLRPSLDLITGGEIVGSLNIASIAAILLIFVGMIILLKKDNLIKIKKNRFLLNANKIFLSLLFISLFSLLNTDNFLISFADWLRLLSVIIIFNYAFMYFSGKENFKRLFFLVLLSAFLPLCMGIYQHLFKMGNQGTAGFNRIYGTFLHPNVFAQYLVMFFFCILYFLRVYKIKLVLKIGLLLVLVLTVLELCFTYARAAWIALFIPTILLGLSHKGISRKILFLFSVLLVLFLFLPHIQSRFVDIIYPKHSGMSSWEWRIMVWNRTKGDIKNHPIVGAGLGMYEQTFKFMAHNDYLRLAYEIGILGLMSYLLYLFYVLFRAIKVVLTTKDDYAKARHMTVICLVLSLLINSVSSNMARSTVILIYLFCVIGALLGPEK